eukprot:3117961-Rhodomonas_salina.1
MRCPVLRYPAALLRGVRLCCYQTRRREARGVQVSAAVSLRARYAMSGTDIAYGAPRGKSALSHRLADTMKK